MPNADKEEQRINRKNSKLATFIQSNIDKIYQSTYYNTPSSKKDLESIKSKIDASIDSIVSDTNNAIGTPNISKMYSRIHEKQRLEDGSKKDLEDLLNDKGMVDSTLLAFNSNSKLTELDAKIDTIIKYMPKLQEALDVRKDNVLSADHFSKDYITITNNTSIRSSSVFNKRIKEIKDRYNLLELFDEIYDNAAKYGEQFIYNVPYKKAIEKLLRNKELNGGMTTTAVMNTESFLIESTISDPIPMERPDFIKPDEKLGINIELEFNTSNMLYFLVENLQSAYTNIEKISESALCYVSEDVSDQTRVGQNKLDTSMDYAMPDDLDFSAFDDDGSQDGLITGIKDREKKIKIDVPGCIIKKLDRHSIIPIYIEDYCMGYYHIENADMTHITDFTKLEDPMMSLRGNSTILKNNEDQIKRDSILKYLAGEMSKYIDSHFVNNNQDLREEIYMILKYNDVYNSPNSKFRVTFLPPEDVEHIYFKKDPITHRGISDLERAIIPATLYASMYITNAIASMTRSQDKRVYYVKQTVDTNIAKTLLTTIEQIKKSNFNIRQIENINHILNITGRFNDYVIPMGPNGDAPISFEVMQGQQIDLKPELMNTLEEMAINTTDVPIELIQARQSIDYAVQLTMTNSKFLRQVYKRQSKYEKFLSKIMSKIYNYEYDENTELELKLPPPMFLNITNTNQILMNTNDFAQQLSDIYLATEEDEKVKATFVKQLKLHYLGSYINTADLENILISSQQEAAIKTPVEGEE